MTTAKVDKSVLRIKYKKPKVYDKGCHKRFLPCEWQIRADKRRTK